MLKNHLMQLLQHCLNYALNLDSSTPHKLKELSGKVIEMVISPGSFKFFICFHEDTVKLLPEYCMSADTTIYSSPIGLLNLSLTPASKIRALFNNQIKITGNLELGQKIKKFIDELDLDIEGEVAKLTGDVVAYQIGSMTRKAIAVQRQFTQSMCENVSEYIQEESCLAPSNEELNYFLQDVDALHLRAERLLELFKLLELKL